MSDEEYNTFLTESAAEQEITPEQLEEVYGEEYLKECVLYEKALALIYESTSVQYIEKE